MKNKLMLVIIACCVGIVIGWLCRERRAPALHETARQRGGDVLVAEQGRATASRLAEEIEDSSDGIPAVADEDANVEYVEEQDEGEERMVRGRIQMQQSAEEVRQAIIDNANLNDAQTAQLDNAIADMNRQMLEVSTKWADRIRETGTLDMDTRLRMQHDINGVSVSFSDKMDTAFPGWRGEDVDLTRLVRVTTAFEPFRKIRSEILRGEMGGKTNTENTEGDE